MSRQIKFRAWSLVERVMYEWNQQFFSDMSPVTSYSSEFPETEELIVLMQYTGLKDKNGKEVYENDIYLNFDNDFVGKLYYLNTGGGFTLYCMEFNQQGRMVTHLPFTNLDTTNFEVIGNIYSNPELLTP